MNKKDVLEFLKKAFGKEKDERVNAIVMTIIYLFIFIILVILFRISPTKVENNEIKQNNNIETKEDISKTEIDDNNENDIDKSELDLEVYDDGINYSYSYIVTYDNIKESYLGKKINSKEIFTYIKDNQMIEYAKINDNFLIKNKNNKYSITDTINNYFKYLDMDILLELSEYPEIKNRIIADLFNEKIVHDNEKLNKIEIINNNGSYTVNLDLSNYLSSISYDNHTFTAKMEFKNIGTTEDFNIDIE